MEIAEYRAMLQVIRDILLKRYNWQQALIDDMPGHYLKKLTEEIKD